MIEKTIIIDGSNPAAEREFQTKILQRETFQQELVEITQHEKKKFSNLKIAAGVLGGAAVALSFMSFTTAPESVAEDIKTEGIPLPDEPEQATHVTDSMSFQEAFDSARTEHGAGAFFSWHGNSYNTYYKQEWDMLTPEEQKEFYNNVVEEGGGAHTSVEHLPEPIVIHDVAPESIFTSDDMSFNDAFAVAREEVGPGGVFEWHGKSYSTYTKDEWGNMDQDDKLAYQDSIEHLHISDDNILYEHEGVLANNTINVNEEYSESGEIFLGQQMVDLGDGQMVSVGIFDHNGVQEIRIDADNNGSYDYVYDPNNETISDFETGDVVADNSGQSMDSNADVPLGTEEVMIDGHLAWVTTFADGRIEANIDADGDGIADSLVHLDTNSGEMSLYDSNGSLIHEEQIAMNDAYANDIDPNFTLDPATSGEGHFASNDDFDGRNTREDVDNNNTESDYNADGNHASNDYQDSSNEDTYTTNENIEMDDHYAANDGHDNYTNDDYGSDLDSGFDNNADMGEWG